MPRHHFLEYSFNMTVSLDQVYTDIYIHFEPVAGWHYFIVSIQPSNISTEGLLEERLIEQRQHHT